MSVQGWQVGHRSHSSTPMPLWTCSMRPAHTDQEKQMHWGLLVKISTSQCQMIKSKVSLKLFYINLHLIKLGIISRFHPQVHTDNFEWINTKNTAHKYMN